MRTIPHLDMNSYFATAEQQANPYLRDQPVGIVKAAGRGCVIAASIEAKKWGVSTGCTVWEAKKRCPQIVFVPSDMDKYFAITQRLIQIVSDYSPTVEVFSIDEMWADVSATQQLFSGGALEIALEMKQRIHQHLGEWLKCSVGISFTKLLAKLASEMHKPNGLTFLNEDDYLAKTAPVAVEEVCGIGYSRTSYLHSRGAYTLGVARQLDNLPGEIADLVWLRNDDNLTTLADLDPAKSVSRTFTTFTLVNSQTAILKLVRNLVEEASSKLRQMQLVGRTLGLSLSSQGQGYWDRLTLISPTDDGRIIFDVLSQRYLQRPVSEVRQAGVWISNLSPDTQPSLFGRRRAALAAVDAVNDQFGLFTLYPGQLLGNELIQPEVTGYLGDKWYRFGKIGPHG
ncbi:MAG: DNA polymerase IV [bacterium]|nr:DNA polymerase IV [bacterium]